MLGTVGGGEDTGWSTPSQRMGGHGVRGGRGGQSHSAWGPVAHGEGSDMSSKGHRKPLRF